MEEFQGRKKNIVNLIFETLPYDKKYKHRLYTEINKQ